MKQFDGYYIFSDVDGTLIGEDFNVPQRNITAIEKFTAEGGHFALSTGRGIFPHTMQTIKALPVNSPCVMLNGGLLYDFSNDAVLFNKELPFDEARTLVNKMLKRYPGRSVAIWGLKDKLETGVLPDYVPPYRLGTPDDIARPWCKLVMENDPQNQQEVIDYINQNAGENMYPVVSCDRFVEVMPNGVTKGTGIEKLIDLLSLERSKVLVIGDYYNDFEMLTLEGVRAFCPENAPDDIKAVCEKSFCNADNGALADLIEYLENETQRS